jgi:hypothetical protein
MKIILIDGNDDVELCKEVSADCSAE